MFFLAFISLIYFFYTIIILLFGNSEESKPEPKYITIVQNTDCENKEGIIGLSSKNILSKLGEKQANEISDVLEEMGPFDAIYCSPFLNTIQTALITLSEPELIVDNGLKDKDNGDWEGKEYSECYTDEVLRKIEEDPSNFKAPNGESLIELETRFVDFLFDVSDEKDKNILVFTHKSLVKSVLRWIDNLDWKSYDNIVFPDGGIIRLKREGTELEICEETHSSDVEEEES